MLLMDLVVLLVFVVHSNSKETSECINIEKPWFAANFVILVTIVPNVWY